MMTEIQQKGKELRTTPSVLAGVTGQRMITSQDGDLGAGGSSTGSGEKAEPSRLCPNASQGLARAMAASGARGLSLIRCKSLYPSTDFSAPQPSLHLAQRWK